VSEIITGEYVPTLWRQGRYTVTRKLDRQPDRWIIDYTITDNKTGEHIEFEANCGWLGSYHSEDEIRQKWAHQQALSKCARPRRLRAY
jgi:hypothetical protein